MKHIIFFLCLIFLGCNSSNTQTEYHLRGSKKYLKIPTSGQINPKTKYLQYFETENISYLLYGNNDKNELIFYELPCGGIYKTIKYEKRGPNGIGSFRGALIKSFDSIFVISATHYNEIFLTDTSGKVLRRYSLEKIEGKMYKPALKPLTCFTQNVIVNKKINLSTYLFSFVENDKLQDETIAIEYDLDKELITRSYNFPTFQDVGKQSLRHYHRAFNGEQYIYSFFRSDDIYIQVSEKDYSVSYGKSRYRRKSLDWKIDKTDPIIKQKSIVLSNPTYRGITYDDYRKILYRFFIPGVETDEKESFEKLFEHPKKFSIQVFDNELNLLSENLFPENTYDPYMGFIAKEGLYLALHYDHPLYNPDSLTFERIDFRKK